MEAKPERRLADPPVTWQEHWFDHRQLLRLCHSDEHCAIYLDPDVRRDEVRWLPRALTRNALAERAGGLPGPGRRSSDGS